LDVIFERKFGVSPVVFRGYTADEKRFPVKLNGALARTFMPMIKRTVWLLRIEKAVKDYYLVFTVNNLASDAIDVIWLEDGKQQVLTIPFKGRKGRSIMFKDRLHVGPVAFEAFLKGTKQRVTLNKQNQLVIVPKAFITRQLFTADKDYTVGVSVRNQVADDIEVRYGQAGVNGSFAVRRGDQFTRDLIFKGPNARNAVQFDAVSRRVNASVKLNGLDVVAISPGSEQRTTELIARLKYYLVLKFENLVQGAVFVKWKSGTGEDRSIKIVAGNETVLEMDFQGVNADRAISFTASGYVDGKTMHLNGMDVFTAHPHPFKKALAIKITEKYYVDVEIRNDVARRITLVWNINKEQRVLHVDKGATMMLSIALDESRSASPVEFEAFVEGSNVHVSLNGTDKITIFPLKKRKRVRIDASKEFYIDIQIKNRVREQIEVI